MGGGEPKKRTSPRSRVTAADAYDACPYSENGAHDGEVTIIVTDDEADVVVICRSCFSSRRLSADQRPLDDISAEEIDRLVRKRAL